MTHPEQQPPSDHSRGPITEAEISLQRVELDNMDEKLARDKRRAERDALEPAAIEYVAQMLGQTLKDTDPTNKNSGADNKTDSF